MSLLKDSIPKADLGSDRLERAGFLVKEYPEDYPDFRATFHMTPDQYGTMGYPPRVIGYWSLISAQLREKSGGRLSLNSHSFYLVDCNNLYPDVYMELRKGVSPSG